MTRSWSLAYLTCEIASPVETIALAARTGYDAVGLRMAPAMPGGAFSPLVGNAALLRETRRALADHGVAVFDVEIVRLKPGFDPGTVAPFLEACGELGARAILVNGDDPDEARCADSLARLCDAAMPYGLGCALEFMPFTQVRDAAAALRVVEAAGRPNATVLVDALHVARSGTAPRDIAAIPPSRIDYAQICDGPAAMPATLEDMIRAARGERLLPGDGGIDVRGLFALLPPGTPVSVEIPNHARRAAVGVEAWAALALAVSRRALEGLD